MYLPFVKDGVVSNIMRRPARLWRVEASTVPAPRQWVEREKTSAGSEQQLQGKSNGD
jgi:hypothetical protein